MIIEAIISTTSRDGRINFAPMGVRLSGDGGMRMTVYHSSDTYRNLRQNPSGVINLTGDVELFVKTALFDHVPSHNTAGVASGGVMYAADEALEFRVDSVEDQGEKSMMAGAVVLERKLRTPQAGINRGRAAVLEALIAVTRIGIMPADEIEAAIRRAGDIVEKTGGGAETRSMELIGKYYDQRRTE